MRYTVSKRPGMSTDTETGWKDKETGAHTQRHQYIASLTFPDIRAVVMNRAITPANVVTAHTLICIRFSATRHRQTQTYLKWKVSLANG